MQSTLDRLLALLHGPEQIADLPVPVGESPGAVSIGHAERGHQDGVRSGELSELELVRFHPVDEFPRTMRKLEVSIRSPCRSKGRSR